MRWLRNGWSQDLRHAVRALRRTPGFTLVAVGTLGLALGVNAGIFSIVDAVLLRPLPFPEPDRLVYIGGTAPGSDLRGEFQLAPEFLIQYQEQSKLLQGVAPYDDFTNTLRVGDRAERVRMAVSTPSLFPTLGVAPVLGRLPAAEDEDRVALLSHGLWKSWFGGDTAVIGRSYYIGGQPADGHRRDGPGVRLPARTASPSGSPRRSVRRSIVPGQFGMGFVGRLRPGADMPALERELGALAQRLPERFGGSPAYADLIRRIHPVVRPLERAAGGPGGRPDLDPVRVGGGRAADRLRQRGQPVPGPRRSGGSASWRCAARSAPAGCSSSGRRSPRRSSSRCSRARSPWCWPGSACRSISASSRPTCRASATSRSAGPRSSSPSRSRRSRRCSAAVLPALRASEPSLDRLRDGSRGSTARRHWARDGLVVAQTALALVLLTGSALLFRSFQKMRERGSGLRHPRHLHLPDRARERRSSRTRPRSPGSTSPSWSGSARLPGVRSVGIVDNVPLNEDLSDDPFLPAERAGDSRGGVMLGFTSVAGDYFQTMGIRLLAGRALTERGPAHRSGPRDRSTARRRTCSGRGSRRSAGGSSGRASRSGRRWSAWSRT